MGSDIVGLYLLWIVWSDVYVNHDMWQIVKADPNFNWNTLREYTRQYQITIHLFINCP
jgi:hypothetical protein